MLNKKYSIDSDKIVWRNIEGEAVILNLDSGFYYSLNKVGTTIWQMITERKNTPNIIEAISKNYNISESKAKTDIELLIKDLRQENLICSK